MPENGYPKKLMLPDNTNTEVKVMNPFDILNDEYRLVHTGKSIIENNSVILSCVYPLFYVKLHR